MRHTSVGVGQNLHLQEEGWRAKRIAINANFVVYVSSCDSFASYETVRCATGRVRYICRSHSHCRRLALDAPTFIEIKFLRSKEATSKIHSKKLGQEVT